MKKISSHPVPIAIGIFWDSLMQVSTGQVGNRQVANLAGVNILRDADMHRHDIRFFNFLVTIHKPLLFQNIYLILTSL